MEIRNLAMITIISTTNRPDSYTLRIANAYSELITNWGETTKVLSFEKVMAGIIESNSFDGVDDDFERLIEEYIIPADRLVVISPEYNGSFPGIFKYFIDATDPKYFRGKKVALVGVATGRAGNLRGMDHLTDIFHHMGAEVYSKKIPISRVHQVSYEDDVLKDIPTLEALEKQLDGFLKF